MGWATSERIAILLSTLLTVRYADDAAMNREMRQVERWNDPAAEFLTVSVEPSEA